MILKKTELLLHCLASSAVFDTSPPLGASLTYKYVWYTPGAQKQILFKVRACSDAHVVLAEYFAITDYNVYEIIIGQNSNRRSVITYGRNGIVLAEQSQPSGLGCNYAEWYWIDWSRGISVGTGYQVGDSFLLSVNASMLPQLIDINAVGITTGPGISGVWEFTSVPGY